MYNIPRGYITDYCGPLHDVVWPFIADRDQRFSNNSIDPAIQLHIRQEVEEPS